MTEVDIMVGCICKFLNDPLLTDESCGQCW